MLFSIITLFPEMFQGVFEHSIIKRAKEKKLIEIKFINLREFGIGKHKTVDDRPYGGGTGMILRVDVVENAIRLAKKGIKGEKVILLDARGKPFKQNTAKELSTLTHIILICGHYEDFDQRIKGFVDEEISIGDYILTGGEIPAMAVVDSLTRLIPGVLKSENATTIESFSGIKNSEMLEYPQYTRPRIYKGKAVPKILLSGDQKKIDDFKTEESIRVTSEKRPDIAKKSKVNI